MREEELFETLAKETVPNMIPSVIAQFKDALESQMAGLAEEAYQESGHGLQLN